MVLGCSQRPSKEAVTHTVPALLCPGAVRPSCDVHRAGPAASSCPRKAEGGPSCICWGGKVRSPLTFWVCLCGKDTLRPQRQKRFSKGTTDLQGILGGVTRGRDHPGSIWEEASGVKCASELWCLPCGSVRPTKQTQASTPGPSESPQKLWACKPRQLSPSTLLRSC